MEIGLGLQRIIAILLLFICQQASAFDGGDAVALILGLTIGLLGLCACIGAYAKRKGTA